MKRLFLLPLFLAVLLLLVSPAQAAPADEKAQDRARSYLRVGIRTLVAATEASAASRRLALADRALGNLHRAHAIQRVASRGVRAFDVLGPTIEGALVRALNVKAKVYLDRGSLVQALHTNRAALSYSVKNAQALKLRVDIHRALITDVYEKIQGRHAITRLRDRHEALGAPLRNRELARRR